MPFCRGVIDGDWLRGGLGDPGCDEARKIFEDASALDRLCTPEDIASPIQWLVSDASAVTGQLVTVDADAMIGHPPQVMPR